MSARKADSAGIAPFPESAGIGARSRALTVTLLLLPPLIALALALTRDFMTYGTETDFLGGFKPEAERLLRGEPMHLDYHPPLYSFVLAGAWLTVREWFTAGLAVSVLAGAGLAAASYALFRRVAGPAAGVGAVIGLAASPVFVRYAVLATSDVFFTFLYVAAFLLGVMALETGSRRTWLACGAAAGLAVLTRTNGLAALVLCLAPALAASRPARAKLADFGWVALGLALPLAAWAFYGLLSDSRLAPALTYGSFAQNYFAEGHYRYEGSVRRMFEARFDGMWDVLLYDPLRIVQVYVRDLLILGRRVFGREELLAFPLNHLAVPGLLWLLLARASPALWLVVVGAVAHVLLINFKAFEARFYLFLVPLMGAAATLLLAALLRGVNAAAPAQRAIAGAIALGAIVQAVVFTYPKLHSQDGLFADLTAARARLAPDPQVLAMRPHAAFYLGGTSLDFPRIDGLRHLGQLLSAPARRGPVYVYVGDYERETWPFVEQLEEGLEWLTPVAHGAGSEAWALYELRAEALE